MEQQYPYQQPGGGRPPPDQTGRGFAIASLVMGILALTIDGIIFGILGIVFAVIAKRSGFTDGFATAGLVMSIIGVASGIILWAICGPVICTLLTLC